MSVILASRRKSHIYYSAALFVALLCNAGLYLSLHFGAAVKY